MRTASVWKRLESEKKSDRGLCQVSEFVDVEFVEPEVGNFVYKPAILRANTEHPCEIETGTAAVYEAAACLTVRTGHDELLGRIEDQCATAAQRVGPDASHTDWK